MINDIREAKRIIENDERYSDFWITKCYDAIIDGERSFGFLLTEKDPVVSDGFKYIAIVLEDGSITGMNDPELYLHLGDVREVKLGI